VKRRQPGPFWVMSATAFALLLAVVGVGFGLQRVALPQPPAASDAALRAAAWLGRYRLVDSTFTFQGRTVHGQCLQDWFNREGRRRRGAVLRLDDGFTLLAVPPHTLVSAGGTAAERAASPLVLLELGGCPRVLARRIQTLAQQRTGIDVVHGALRFGLDATQVTMTLAAATGMPTAVRVVTPSVTGSGQIRFQRVTNQIRHELQVGLPDG
jgi:hypothetical protein